MKSVGTFNKIPDGIKVPILKKGQYVLYRLLDPTIDPNDVKKEKLLWPFRKKIPTLDVISNPQTGEPIQIGVVDKVDRDNNPTIKTYWVAGMENNGYFTLVGGRGHDDYLHWYFELTNYNQSNTGRDQSVMPMFERIDRVADAKKSLKKRDEELDALIYIREMNDKDLILLAAALGWDENEDIDVLREKANTFAKLDPKKFSLIVRSKDVELKATIKRANDLDIIKYSVQQNKVTWASNGETIATLPRVEGQDWLTSMIDWVKTSKNGEKTYDAIKKQLYKDVEAA